MNENIQAWAKVMAHAANDFPDFSDMDAVSSKVVDVSTGRLSNVVPIDLAKFLGARSESYAWIQIGAYQNGIALEKQCYPVRFLKQ